MSFSHNFALPGARRAVSAILAVFAAALLSAVPASAATRQVAPAGADTGNCLTVPCASLRYAYGQSASGDVVSVAPGLYGGQSVPSGSKPVTFRGGPGVVLRQMVNDASNVTYDGISVDADGAHTTGAAFELGGDGVTVRNASVGNVTDEKVMLATGSNLTVDNVNFHDAILRTDGVHMECLYAIGVQGFTLRNSTFRDCAIMDAFFTYGSWWSPKPPAYGNVTIENNVFGHPERENNGGWHYYSLYIAWIGPNGASDPMDGWIVRHNTFESPASINPGRGVNSRWVGNLGSWDCKTGVTFHHNVGRGCSAQDKAVNPASSSSTRVAPLGWLDPAGHDFRLKPGSPGINAGDPSDGPATDRLGLPRDTRPDAGAYEFGVSAGGGATLPPPRAGARRLAARLKPKTICRRPRRGCPRMTKLRVAVSVRSRISVRVKRLRRGHRPSRVRSLGFHVARQRTRRIDARRLAPGRYVVVVRAHRAGKTTKARMLRLRVR